MSTEHGAGSLEQNILGELQRRERQVEMEREGQQRVAELLAERALRDANIQRERAAEQERSETASQRPEGAARGTFGWLFLLAGLCGMIYFLLLFDVSAPVQESPREWFDATRKPRGERIVNLGLMNDRQVGATVSGFVFLAGCMVVVLGGQAKRNLEIRKSG